MITSFATVADSAFDKSNLFQQGMMCKEDKNNRKKSQMFSQNYKPNDWSQQIETKWTNEHNNQVKFFKTARKKKEMKRNLFCRAKFYPK